MARRRIVTRCSLMRPGGYESGRKGHSDAPGGSTTIERLSMVRAMDFFSCRTQATPANLANAVTLLQMSRTDAGRCDECRHQQLVPNTRGSVFSLCRRSRSEPELYPRYPRLPVIRCPGFEPG